MQKYKFRPYNLKFLALYYREKAKLKKILPTAKIDHVGSTAVPELGGKGLIDILITVKKKDIAKTKKSLEKNNYKYKHIKDKERLFFQKDYKYKGKVRRVHIHLTFHNSYTWKSHIALRDYLRKYKKEAREYAKIKKQAVSAAKGEGKVYRKYKDNFLKKLTKKALKEFN
jgi:GrpB-like predicted nucleotidyltransferase (UPF0157 family)